jgi:hypothetical protein
MRALYPRLHAVALAIQEHEGFIPGRGPKPGSRAWRNHNPGNLRKSALASDYEMVNGEPVFARFPDYHTGFLALMVDVFNKCIGHTVSKLSLDSTLADLIRVWAPPSENDTNRYIDAVVAKTQLPAATTLRELIWP